MGNTIASGSGQVLEVGKNCQKLTPYTSDIIITFVSFYTYKISYNNSKYGKFCLAGTQDRQDNILAQNKCFNFQWAIYDDGSGNFVVMGNHTKKCEKNSIAFVEFMEIKPTIAQANKEILSKIAKKLDKDSELAKHINTLRKKKL